LIQILRNQTNFQRFIDLFKNQKLHDDYTKLCAGPQNQTIELTESSEEPDEKDYLYFLDDYSSEPDHLELH
jgi:hypothetical protein